MKLNYREDINSGQHIELPKTKYISIWKQTLHGSDDMPSKFKGTQATDPSTSMLANRFENALMYGSHEFIHGCSTIAISSNMGRSSLI